MKLLLALVLAVLMVALIVAWQRAASAEINVPAMVDESGQFVLVPVDWFRALIDTHNQHVMEIRRLKSERCG